MNADTMTLLKDGYLAFCKRKAVEPIATLEMLKTSVAKQIEDDRRRDENEKRQRELDRRQSAIAAYQGSQTDEYDGLNCESVIDAKLSQLEGERKFAFLKEILSKHLHKHRTKDELVTLWGDQSYNQWCDKNWGKISLCSTASDLRIAALALSTPMGRGNAFDISVQNKKLAARLASKISDHFQGRRTCSQVGLQTEQFRSYVASLWEPWMNWGNYSRSDLPADRTWELDRVFPPSKMDLSDPEQYARAIHYSNYRPLQVLANERKFDTVDEKLIQEHYSRIRSLGYKVYGEQ